MSFRTRCIPYSHMLAKTSIALAPAHIRRARLAALILGATALLTLLRALPPKLLPWLPACPIRRYLHLLCPGCGATHALLALLDGHLAAAFTANPLFVPLLPCLIAWTAVAAQRYLAGQPAPWPRLPQPLLAALLLAAGVFTVLRNL